MCTQRNLLLFTTLGALLLVFSACNETPPPPPPTLDGETEIILGTGFPIESTIYGESRTINVYLPMGYAERNENFPVLYLIDGGAHQDFIPMAGMAALATLSGQYREFILVGIQSNDRYFELTAPSDLEVDLGYLPHNGGANQFRQFLKEEVKPFITNRYRTTDEDAIIGESLAALFITETFLRTPESFDHFIAISPSLWWRDMSLSKEAAALLQADGFPENRSFYLTVADEGGTMLESVERVSEALKNHAPASLSWWYQPKPDEHHNTIYNPAALEALRLVFKKQ